MTKFKSISKVYLEEIPSFHTNDDGEFYVSNGLHINILYNKDRHHKLYISNEFKTMYRQFKLDVKLFSVYDLLAFHTFNYIKHNCNFNNEEYKILWKMLRQSNNLFKTIQKFVISMLNYYQYQT